MNQYSSIKLADSTGDYDISIPASNDEYLNIRGEFASENTSFSSRDYGRVLFANQDIFQNESSIESFTVAPQIKQTAKLIISELKDQISSDTSLENHGKLPSLAITQTEDSILLEWPFRDFRMCFNVYDNITDSSWFIVASKRFQDAVFSDDLSTEELPKIVSAFINIAKALI